MRKLSTIIKEGYFYLPIGMEEKDHTQVYLFTRRYQLRKRPSGQTVLAVSPGLILKNTWDEIGDYIEGNQMAELPPEADGNLTFVPKGFEANLVERATTNENQHS